MTTLQQVVNGQWVDLGTGVPTASGPTARASASPVSGTAPLAVAFSSAGSTAVAPATIASYSWAFGDGSTSTSANPSHTYAAAGSYTARLTVTDSTGLTAVATAAVTVSGTTTSKTFVFGMFNSTSVPGSGNPDGQTAGAGFPGGGDTLANWLAVRAASFNPDNLPANLMPIKVRRVFQSGTSVPASIVNTAGAQNHANGITTHLSFKADPASIIAGTWDSQLTSLAASMFDGDAVTYWHEPENDDIDPVKWRDASIRVYQKMKAARPGLNIGPCYIPFRWNTNGTVTWGNTTKQTLQPDAIDLGDNCDFRACDPYYMEGSSGATTMATEPHFAAWHAYHSAKVYSATAPISRRGKKFALGLMEFGIVQTFEKRTRTSATAPWGAWTYTHPYNDSTSPSLGTVLANSIDWVVANGYVFLLFWNSWHADYAAVGATGSETSESFRDMNLSPTNSDTTHVVPQALATFNAKVRQYAKTSDGIYATP